MKKLCACHFCDFECVNLTLINTTTTTTTTTTNNNDKHISQQEPCAFAYKVVCEDPKYTNPTKTYVGNDASKKCIECMMEEQRQCMQILDYVRPMTFTNENKNEFESANSCCICEKPFTAHDRMYGKIVRHHNHLTPKYIGAACNSCNINCKQNKYFLPIVIHNCRGYDSHLIMQSIGLFKDSNIKCIAYNMEKYIAFSLGPLRFIDSLQFMNSSLDKLVENLKLSGETRFELFYQDFQKKKHADLLLRKGVFSLPLY